MINPDDPAFPTIVGPKHEDGFPQLDHSKWQAPGLSIRTEIASRALQGFIARSPSRDIFFERLAADAVKVADALIEELNKTQ